MTEKIEISRVLSFIDGNVRFQPINIAAPVEIWKLLVEIDIIQKSKSPFKITAKYSNKLNDESELLTAIFEFNDTSVIRKMIYGNPFEMNETLINHIMLEYSDYEPKSFVKFWIYLYEMDAETREALYPFSSTK